jgi:hypothetical protein
VVPPHLDKEILAAQEAQPQQFMVAAVAAVLVHQVAVVLELLAVLVELE